MKKCPPGVICLENYTLFFICTCIVILGYLLVSPHSPQNITVNTTTETSRGWLPDLFSPPLQYMPINVATNIGAVNTEYRQVGILNSTNSTSKILPLMGRPLFTNRDKWQYYTSSADGFTNIKLPVSRSGKSCTNEYGCDKLYNGDTVYVEGINEAYRITMYDNDTMRYLPII